MAYFPTSPLDGESVTVNGIVYTYNSSKDAWKRSLSTIGNLDVSGNITAANITVTANAAANKFFVSEGVFWAGNGVAFASSTYSNANVASYFVNGANIGSGSTTANLVAAATTTSTDTTTGALVVKGGAGVAGNINVGGNVKITDGTSSTSKTTGALVVTGGVGVGGSLNANDGTISASWAVSGFLQAQSTFPATSAIGNSAFTVAGGAGIAGNLYVDGNVILGSGTNSNLVANATTTSTSTTTGALVVRGGAGIAGSLWIANTNDVSANIGTLFQGNASTQANLGAFQTFSNANAATQATSINTINANLGAYQLYANANIGTLFLGNTTTQANLGAFQTFSNANAATQATSINTINANLGAYQLYANANIGTLFNGNISTNANLGAFQTFSNANAATQATSINTINANLGSFQSYANAKIGSNAGGNVVIISANAATSTTSGALQVAGGAGIAGNVYTDKLFTTTGIFWAANNAPWMAQFTASPTAPVLPSLGSYWYKTTTDVVYEYINDGVNSFWIDIFTPPYAANVVTSTYIGDAYAGNITFTGSITGSVGYLLERANVVVTAPPATTNLDLITAPIIYFTSNSTQNVTANIRGNATTTLNSMLAIGQSATFVVFMPNATAYYVNTVKIDNTTVTPYWQGGSTLTGGNANSVDIYTFAVLKTANATFRVFASQVRYQNLGP